MSDPLAAPDLARLLLRAGIGVVFIAHGYPKMTGRGKLEKAGRESLARSLAGLRLPCPRALAVIVGVMEFFGGLLLIFGLETQWTSLALALIMLVASGRNFIRTGFVGSADFPFFLLVALIALAFLGGGTVSVDQILVAGR
jgi:putative oxidoreductase